MFLFLQYHVPNEINEMIFDEFKKVNIDPLAKIFHRRKFDVVLSQLRNSTGRLEDENTYDGERRRKIQKMTEADEERDELGEYIDRYQGQCAKYQRWILTHNRMKRQVFNMWPQIVNKYDYSLIFHDWNWYHDFIDPEDDI